MYALLYACMQMLVLGDEVGRGQCSCSCTLTVAQAAAKHPTCILQAGRHAAVYVGRELHACHQHTAAHWCCLVVCCLVQIQLRQIWPGSASSGVWLGRGVLRNIMMLFLQQPTALYYRHLYPIRPCCTICGGAAVCVFHSNRFDCRPGSRASSTQGLGWSGGASAWVLAAMPNPGHVVQDGCGRTFSGLELRTQACCRA